MYIYTGVDSSANNICIELLDAGYQQHRPTPELSEFLKLFRFIESHGKTIFKRHLINCLFDFEYHPLGKQVLDLMKQDFTLDI
jgi:hypothetical protein